jgi:protein required for attachment to host cells
MSKMMLKKGDLVVIADGEKALLLVNEGDEKFPNLQVHRQLAQENPPNREQMSDRQGRARDSVGSHRSAVEEADWHRIEKERFAHDLADRIYKMAHRGDFGNLVVAAPPLVLGALRKEFHKEVNDRLIGEISKTLTNHPVDVIEKMVTGGQ